MTDINLAFSPAAGTATHGPAAIAAAQATDPRALGWMQGSPPAADRLVRYADGSMSAFPQLRWAWSNMRQLLPTVAVPRGDAPPRLLPVALRDDLDDVLFQPGPGSGFDAPIRWEDGLLANFNDGIIVVHRGTIVYERYFGALDATRPHLLASVSKSVAGTIAAMLVADGSLDPHAPVASWIPELAPSGFGDATLRQVMDMTTAIAYSEDYTSPTADIADLVRAAGMAPPRADTPAGIRAYLPSIAKAGTHGEAFTYRTANTDVLGWILHRATATPLPQLVSETFWQRLGMEQDAYYSVDACGTEFAGGALNAALRDLARFGEMMRNHGGGIVPPAVVADIAGGGDPAKFVPAGYTTLPGWSYRSQWWVSDHGPYTARGVRGQMIWIDPGAEMVIARLASHPLAGNANLDPASLPAWAAMAAHLARH